MESYGSRVSWEINKMTTNVDIGSSMHIKGELTGKEDLTIEGTVEGKIRLKGHQLTIGEKGQVSADIRDASAVVVLGKMIGNIAAGERVEIAATGTMQGDISAPRIVLADGARFKGSIDMVMTPGGGGPPKPPK